MKVDRIEVYHVDMPLKYPWRTAYGEDWSIQSVLVKMSGDGEHGWGEAAPFAAPCYSPEFAGGAFAAVRDWLGQRLVGQNITSGEDLGARLSMFKGNQFAKAALDTAWWTLSSKLENKPLHTARADLATRSMSVRILALWTRLMNCCRLSVRRLTRVLSA